MDQPIPLWIGGKQLLSDSTFDIVSPQTNSVCWKATNATTEDAVKAIEAAQAALPSWSQLKPDERQQILFKAADLLEARITEYGSFMQTEMGAEMGVANFWVLPTAIKFLRGIASQIPAICGRVPIVQDVGRSAMVWKEPYGVVFGISPWNAPYALGMRAAATAIAAGNTTVLKGSELTPRCYWALGQIFEDAGVPPGVLNIIYCNAATAPELVKAVIAHPAVKHVNFTGSTNTGRIIARTCGDFLKPCLMELGGKSSAIVLADADLVKAAKQCIAGSFLNSGQTCMTTGRLILHKAIAEEFLAITKAGLEEFGKSSPAPPLVVSSDSQARLQSLVSEALSQGGQIVAGINDPEMTKASSSALFPPVLIGGVSETSKLWQDETFGPLVSYLVVENEEEAVAVANKTNYGLSAAVFTQDLRKGFAVAKKLESGAVHINSMTVHDEPALPHGGVKDSGWGRFNTAQGIEEFLVTKTVTWDD